MTNREFLQLAHTYNPSKHGIGGWYESEKLDGMRCYWDGRLTTGMYASDVDFANTAKDDRLKEPPVATGLWSRYGNIIHAPDWFVNQLPDYPLDGELYLGRKRFQELISIVKNHTPDDRWNNVHYMVYDLPPDSSVFRDGRINNPNFKKVFQGLPKRDRIIPMGFKGTLAYLTKECVNWGENILLHEQHRLPIQTDKAEELIEEKLQRITILGGEGLILRRPEAIWQPKRCDAILKVKKWKDSEGDVVGYTWGRGKLEDLMGAVIVRWRGKSFDLSGFTDEERMLTARGGKPGTPVHYTITNQSFPRGSRITFKYRELTNDGLPKEARYFRNVTV